MNKLLKNRFISRLQFKWIDGDYVASFTDEKVLEKYFKDNPPKNKYDNRIYSGLQLKVGGENVIVEQVQIIYNGNLLDEVLGVNLYLVGDEEKPSNIDILVLIRKA